MSHFPSLTDAENAIPDPTAEELEEMDRVAPIAFEEIPIGLRERILGPQRGSFVTVEVDDMSLLGKVERYDMDENVVEVDFYGWYGEFQITHSVARIVLRDIGLVITSDDAARPFESRPGVILGN